MTVQFNLHIRSVVIFLMMNHGVKDVGSPLEENVSNVFLLQFHTQG